MKPADVAEITSADAMHTLLKGFYPDETGCAGVLYLWPLDAAADPADWAEAVKINERILELGADSEAENRLAKAYWEMGELAIHFGSLDELNGLIDKLRG